MPRTLQVVTLITSHSLALPGGVGVWVNVGRGEQVLSTASVMGLCIIVTVAAYLQGLSIDSADSAEFYHVDSVHPIVIYERVHQNLSLYLHQFKSMVSRPCNLAMHAPLPYFAAWCG